MLCKNLVVKGLRAGPYYMRGRAGREGEGSVFEREYDKGGRVERATQNRERERER